jgi:hypothetical protein
MPGIAAPMQDILTLMLTVPGVKHVNIWNNQIKDEDKGDLYDFPKPALFLEVISHPAFEEIGLGLQSADMGFRIHIAHEFYDDGQGNFERNFPVILLRDDVIATLSHFWPTACGPLIKKTEAQDPNHTNIYHYVIDFVCNFTDSKGSPYDVNAGKHKDSVPPTDLEIDASEVQVIAPPTRPVSRFRIPS